MITVTCPWCSADVRLEPAELELAQLECEACATTWLTDAPETADLALAA